MARIEQDYYTVELVPECTTEHRYIYDDGDYNIVGTDNGQDVFEGGFDYDNYQLHIVSSEWMALFPHLSDDYFLRRFKLIG